MSRRAFKLQRVRVASPPSPSRNALLIPHSLDPRRGPTARFVPALPLVLALAASVLCLPNQWCQDDRPVIAFNITLHSLSRVWSIFTHAYWPEPFPQELYRPLTSLTLAFQWVLGRGNPLAFRIGSILLYVAATWAVYQVAKRLLTPAGAVVAASLFAVHPVHVEAVAVAVNQAELWVVVLLGWLVVRYIDRRRSGAALDARWIVVTAVGYFAAILFKESAAVLPGLLLAVELVAIDDRRAWRERLAALRPFALVLVLAVTLAVAARTAVLGNLKGTFTAEALVGLSMGGRALTMLGVVPQWARLLIWPAHLQADYSPQVIVAATHWGWSQTLGAAILLAAVTTALWCRRRRPAVTIGILWMAVALFPVSNVLVPTGIVLAERTLFLATVGTVLAAADLLTAAGTRLYAAGAIGRAVTVACTTAVFGLALVRSTSRDLVWHDEDTLWHQTLDDAPLSYRAHFAYAQILFEAKLRRSAEYHYQRAMQLYPPGWPVALDLADRYRLAGDCYPAIRLYQRVLRLDPYHTAARASLITCQVLTGDYVHASREAKIGAQYGQQPKSFALYGAIADSALRVHARIGTVRLPPPVDSAVAQ